MSVLVDQNTRLIVQGFTGREGTFHAQQAIAYGTTWWAAWCPARAAAKHLDLPVFDTVAQAVKETGANATRDFRAAAVRRRRHHGSRRRRPAAGGVHHRRHSDARHGAAWQFLQGRKTRLIGPNCPGIISPGKCKIGIMPGHIHKEGNVGVVSRSGTLTYEAVGQLTKLGIGQSTCIGIGGDPIIGTNFLDALALFNDDPDTHAIVMIGEIGGNAEETAAAYVKAHVKKPVVGFVAGQTAPPGRRMGHAGAIIAGGSGKASDKIKAMEEAGITVCLARRPKFRRRRVQSSLMSVERTFPSSNPMPWPPGRPARSWP